MPTVHVQLQRFSVVSARPFDEVLNSLVATIGQSAAGRARDVVQDVARNAAAI